MKILTADELGELRADIAHLGLSAERLDEIIHILDNIVISVIDQARGQHSVQLSLSARANYAFKNGKVCASLQKSESFETVDLDIEGANNTNIPKGIMRPGRNP